MRAGQKNVQKHISYVLQKNTKMIILKSMPDTQFGLNNSLVRYHWADCNFWHSTLGADGFQSPTSILEGHGKDI